MLLGTVAFAWQQIPLLGVVVGVAICAAMGIAAMLGGLLPLIFARFRIDPAVASGSFLTTAIDIIWFGHIFDDSEVINALMKCSRKERVWLAG